MNGSMNNGRPLMAIVNSNMLATIGLKQLLQHVMPIITIETFASFEELESNNADRFFHQEIMKTVTSFDYSADWLKGLKERGYNIYLLTNYPEWLFETHWKKGFTFVPYVDGKVVSGKVKLIKPDHAIYETIIKKYSLNPAESVFIDDVKENVQAAKETGLNAIQFTNINDVKNQLEKLLASD